MRKKLFLTIFVFLFSINSFAVSPGSVQLTPGVTYSSLKVVDGFIAYSDLASKMEFRTSGLTLDSLFSLNSISYSSPYTGLNGTKYFLGGTDGQLNCFGPSGQYPEWVIKCGGSINSSPVTFEIGGVNYIYFTSTDGKIYCFNISTRTQVWEYDIKSVSWSGPVVVTGNQAGALVIVAAYNGNIYAIKASDGSFFFEYQTGSKLRSSGAVNNGIYYIGNTGGKVVALDTSSSSVSSPVVAWSYQTEGQIFSAPCVDSQYGTIYTGTSVSTNSYVYALNSNGTLKWSFTASGQVVSSPVLNGKNLVFGSNSGAVYALNKNSGSVIWSGSTGGNSSVELDALSIDRWVAVKSVDGVLKNFGDVIPEAVMPSVSAVSPDSGLISVPVTVQLSGSGFFAGEASSDVISIQFDDSSDTSLSGYTVTGDSVILNAIIPSGISSGTYNVRVTTSSGTNSESSQKYIALGSWMPMVGNVSPVSGHNNVNTTVNITGISFFGGTGSADVSQVVLDTVPVTVLDISNASITNTSISNAVVPSGVSAGTYNIKVTNSYGSNTTSAQKYTITVPPMPTVSGFSPMSGYNTQSVTVSVAGTNFFGGASSSAVLHVVLAGTTNVTISCSNVTNTSLQATVPSGISAGEYSIIVETSVGASDPSVSEYTAIVPVPTVTGISPSTRPANASTTVTINGTNFYAGTSSSAVTDVSFAGSSTVTLTGRIVNSDTQLSAIVPVNLNVGIYTVRVSTTSGTSTDSVCYTVTAADYNVLYLHMDGANNGNTFTDSSLSTKTPYSLNGTPTTSTIQKRLGTASGLFDNANGDSIKYADSTDWEFGTGDFTIDCWVKPDGYPDYGGLCGTSNSSSYNQGYIFFLFYGTGELFFAYYENNTSIDTVSSIPVPNGVWSHVAVVRHGSDLNLYINGISYAHRNVGNHNFTRYTGGFVVGRAWTTEVQNFFKGNIDDFRVTKGLARWTSNFDPLEERIVLNLHMDGSNNSTTITDSSTCPKAVTVNGNACLNTSSYKFGGSSLILDGTGDYLALPASDDWSFGTEDFTIDCWAKRNGSQSSAGLVSSVNNSQNTGFSLNVQTGNVEFASNASGSWATDLLADIELKDGAWTHIALVRHENILTLYLDGVAHGSKDVTGYSYTSSSAGLMIGRYYADQNNYYYNGKLDEVRISKGVARWTSNFTPQMPSEVLLLHMDGVNNGNTFTDSSPSAKTPSGLNGSPTTSTAEMKYGTASGLFHNNYGDSIQYADSTDWEFGTEDFTIDCWVRPDGYPDYGGLCGTSNSSSYNQGYIFFLFCGSGELFFAYYESNTSFDTVTSIPVPNGVWSHVAVVRHGSDLNLYINGVSYAHRNVGNHNFTRYTGGFVVGRAWTTAVQNFYKGNIDDFRVLKNAARWTSNFTPVEGNPTTEVDISGNNPGFETWTNGTIITNPVSDVTNLANAWKIAWGGGNLPCVISRESTLKTEGNYSLKQTMATSGVSATSWGVFTQYSGYESYLGQTVRMTADVYCSVANKASISLTPYSDRHGSIRSTYSPANTWTTLSVDLYVPEDADDLQLVFGSDKSPSANEVYIIDNVRLYCEEGGQQRMFMSSGFSNATGTSTATSIRPENLPVLSKDRNLIVRDRKKPVSFNLENLATTSTPVTLNELENIKPINNYVPVLKTIAPDKIAFTHPVQVTISGSNFFGGTEASDVSSIIVGSIPVKLSNIKVSDKMITGTIDPAHVPMGENKLQIFTGKGTSNSVSFTVERQRLLK